jgi:hypothetical protein
LIETENTRERPPLARISSSPWVEAVRLRGEVPSCAFGSLPMIGCQSSSTQ